VVSEAVLLTLLLSKLAKSRYANTIGLLSHNRKAALFSVYVKKYHVCVRTALLRIRISHMTVLSLREALATEQHSSLTACIGCLCKRSAQIACASSLLVKWQ
jgi:hypothetical protein